MSVGLLRLAWGALCLGAAVLILAPAPAYPLWLAAVAATEWCHVLALLSALALVPFGPPSAAGRAAALLGAAALLIALTPLVRARDVARTLPSGLREAFGPGAAPQGADAPFQLQPLLLPEALRGAAAAPVREWSAVYSRPAPGVELGLDLYAPEAGGGPRPAVVVIHGGSWQSGDRGEFKDFNRWLASRGYVVASVDYRLAPLWPFPAAAEDVRAALAWLRTRAGELGLDPSRIVTLGRSAGGQLALLAAYTDPSVRGVVAFYAPADLKLAYELRGNPLVIDGPAILSAYLKGPPGRFPELYEAASPLSLAGRPSPPTLLIHGDKDELVWVGHSELLEKKLKDAGRPCYFLRLPWATHGCDANLSGPCGQLSAYAVERFLASVTAPAS